MNNKISAGISLLLAAVFLMSASVAVAAASKKQMRACHDAVISKQKFQDLPMAAFSMFPGNKGNRVNFTVRWGGLKADGHCQVSKQGKVKNVDIVRFHNTSAKNMAVTTTGQGRVMVSTTTGISESGAIPRAGCVTAAQRKTVS